jgi:hypothetical protein
MAFFDLLLHVITACGYVNDYLRVRAHGVGPVGRAIRSAPGRLSKKQKTDVKRTSSL